MPEAAFKSIIADMIEDLIEFAIVDIECSIRAHRQDPKQRFFPTSGQLRAGAIAAHTERTAASKPRKPIEFDSRPLRWWTMPRAQWRQHWHDHQIPAADQETFHVIEALRSPTGHITIDAKYRQAYDHAAYLRDSGVKHIQQIEQESAATAEALNQPSRHQAKLSPDQPHDVTANTSTPNTLFILDSTKF
jgi:hypothetical protein